MDPRFGVDMEGFDRADIINSHFGGGYKWTETTKHKYQDVIGSVFATYNFDGIPPGSACGAAASAEFTNNLQLGLQVRVQPQSVNDRRTRGGAHAEPAGRRGLHVPSTPTGRRSSSTSSRQRLPPESGSWDTWLCPGIE
jgi:hypothetical protein